MPFRTDECPYEFRWQTWKYAPFTDHCSLLPFLCITQTHTHKRRESTDKMECFRTINVQCMWNLNVCRGTSSQQYSIASGDNLCHRRFCSMCILLYMLLGCEFGLMTMAPMTVNKKWLGHSSCCVDVTGFFFPLFASFHYEQFRFRNKMRYTGIYNLSLFIRCAMHCCSSVFFTLFTIGIRLFVWSSCHVLHFYIYLFPFFPCEFVCVSFYCALFILSANVNYVQNMYVVMWVCIWI